MHAPWQSRPPLPCPAAATVFALRLRRCWTAAQLAAAAALEPLAVPQHALTLTPASALPQARTDGG